VEFFDVTQSAQPQCPATEKAIRSLSSNSLFWIGAALTVAADLISKWWTFKFIKPGEHLTVISDFLYFQLTQNYGAVFGMGKGKVWVFIIASLVAMFFIIQLFVQSRSRQTMFHFFLAITLGGAIGNLYDRCVFGYVRDFIFVSIRAGGKELWPWVFNVADMALVVGVAGLLIGWFFGKFDMTNSQSCRVARPISGPVSPIQDVESCDSTKPQ
jgi:signal peptidase II